MSWKNYFREMILERGKTYYQRNRVMNLTYQNLIYKARVLGEVGYDVEIKMRDEDIIYMKCTCPYAASGQHCKHMAAVMYAIEEQGEELKNQQNQIAETVIPFSTVESEYHYFDMGRIAGNLEVSRTVYDEAKRLIHKKSVVLDEVRIRYYRYQQGVVQGAVAEGHYTDGRIEKEIEFCFLRDKIISANCQVPGCSGYYGDGFYYTRKEICKHILALMILLDEYLKKYNPGDSTSPGGIRFVQQFRGIHFKEQLENQVEEQRDLQIEPVLERNGDLLKLSLKAGVEKLYVVKKLSEFVANYTEKESMLFGTKTEIDFAKHRLMPEAEGLFAFVKQIVDEEQNREMYQRTRTDGYYEAEEIKNFIPLYGARMDEFYDMFEGHTLPCNDKTGYKTKKINLKLQNGKPDIQIQIEQDVDEENIFHGVSVKGNVPSCIYGRKYYYFFRGDTLSRMDETTKNSLLPLFDMAEYEKISFRVGRKHLSEFYHQILPILRENANVEEPEAEAVAAYVPPEPKFVFYLDAEKGRVICKPRVKYADTEVSLLDTMKGEVVPEPFRNIYLESEILFCAKEFFKEISLEEDEMYCGEEDEEVLYFMDSGIDRLMSLGEVQTTDRFRSMNVRRRPKLKMGVSLESDIMNLTISSDDIDQEELLQILQSYQRKKKYYRLKNGDFVTMQEEDVEMLSQLMETLQISPKEFVKGNMKIPVYRALYLNKMLEQSENVYLERDKHFRNLIKEFKTVEDSDFEVPAQLHTVMRNYQVQGFKWMKTLEQYGFGGILADDMGLGKTLQMISVLQSAKENSNLGTALIVSPASLVFNWKEEFAKFAPDMTVTLVVGTQTERADVIKNYEKSDVLVTSYDLLKRDIAEYEGLHFQYQVLDEAQYIKNHGTAAAKATKIIQSTHRYALTGTPIENRLSELWSIFDYLMPGFLYGYETFRRQLETPIVKYKEQNASEQLKKMVSPFIMRRLKTDVLKDLPDKLEEVRYAKMDTEQRRIYDGQVVHMKHMLEAQEADDFQKNKLQILAELTRIRQICCDPELLFEKYKEGSAKRLACMELIQSAMEGEHKILVFSQFTSMLELLEKDLKSLHIGYYKIIGATPKEKRVEMVRAFNEDDTPVFLISLKAGGTGLNLTGADVVIHYDPWWNQAAQNQATDRAHRIGQTKNVTVYKLIVKDTIEEKIVQMQETKRNLADSVLEGENGSITQMSKEELLELFCES